MNNRWRLFLLLFTFLAGTTHVVDLHAARAKRARRSRRAKKVRPKRQRRVKTRRPRRAKRAVKRRKPRVRKPRLLRRRRPAKKARVTRKRKSPVRRARPAKRARVAKKRKAPVRKARVARKRKAPARKARPAKRRRVAKPKPARKVRSAKRAPVRRRPAPKRKAVRPRTPARKKQARRSGAAQRRAPKPQPPRIPKPPKSQPPTVAIGAFTCPGYERRLNTNVVLKQVNVLPQFGPGGGGAASCGYHSLKNSMLIARALGNTGGNICDELNDRTLVTRMFGPTGAWRQRAKVRRDEYAVNYVLREMFRGFVRQAGAVAEPNALIIVGKIRDRYLNIITAIVRQLAARVVGGQTVDIDRDGLVRMIQAMPWQSVSDVTDYGQFTDNSALQLFLYDQNTIARYIDLNAVGTMHFDYDFISVARGLYNANAHSTGLFSALEVGGDWLNEAELLSLINVEQQPGGMMHGQSYDISIIQDMYNLDFLDLSVLARVRQALSVQDTYTHVFLVGTMDRQGETAGHWFAVVLHKFNGRQEYIVADSLNHERLQGGRLKLLLQNLGISS